MKRLSVAVLLVAGAALAAPALLADVKTSEKSTFKMEGFMGAMMNRMGGGANGITTNVALKGSRMARIGENGQGQIVDLSEQKIYTVDMKKKEYSVMTFAELKAQMEKARAEMAKQQAQMSAEDKQALSDASKELELDVKAEQGTERRTIAGQDTREAVITIALRQKGKTLEEAGGMVMTNTLWLAPRVPALEEMRDFNVKMFQAMFGGSGSTMDMQQANAMTAMIPGLGTLMERMGQETRKLQGTPLASTTVIETVKAPADSAAAQPQQPPRRGLGGMLGGMMAGRGGGQKPRSTLLTTTQETLSIGSTVSAEDVAIPAGFREKKP